MYEIMMYAGAIGCIVFFVISVVLFIKNKIPASIMYFVNLRRKGVDIWTANKKLAKQKSAKPEKTVLLQDAPVKMREEPTALLEESSGDGTEVIDTDHTELLEDMNTAVESQPEKAAAVNVSVAKAAGEKKGKNSSKKSKKKKQPKVTNQRPAQNFEPTELLGDISQQSGGSEPTELLEYIAQQASSGEPTELLDDLPKVQGFEPTQLLDDIPDYYTKGSQTELLD